jgi:hypothetical protein
MGSSIGLPALSVLGELCEFEFEHLGGHVF